MQELVLEGFGFKKNSNKKNDTFVLIKKIANDSLFYFGLFLLAFFFLNSIPFSSNLLEQINIGINEVIVSFVGFFNVFFVKVFYQVLQK